MSDNSENLVLVTGGSGHIGFRVLVDVLKAGYRVRAAVRNQAKADLILNAPSIKALGSSSDLSFTFVSDLLAQGAYDDAVTGVNSIIHLASPITSGLSEDKFETDLLQPAVEGTLSILYAAQKSPSVERVVITSSGVAQMTWHDFFEVESDEVVTEKSRVPDPEVGKKYSAEFEAYCASKIKALNATEQWIAETKPKFDVVHVHPGFVIGRNELIDKAEDIIKGTNSAAFGQPFPLPGASVHLDDVSFLHVKALDKNLVPGGQSLLAVSEGPKGTTWADALDVIAKHFPKAVQSGTLPNNGYTGTKRVKMDAAETQKLLDFKFKNYEEQVLDVAQYYLHLVGVEAA